MIRRQIELSPQAIDDLIEIYEFIAEKNPTAARNLLDSIEAKIRDTAISGGTGVARDWIRPGLRALPFKDCCIYFRVEDSMLRILRIVHGRQSIGPEDFTESNH